MEQGTFYTNGHYLIILIPPPLGVNYGFTNTQQICRKFSLEDGIFICNSLVTDKTGISKIKSISTLDKQEKHSSSPFLFF